MVGLMYLKIKRNWRAWIKIALLSRKSNSLLKNLKSRKKEENVVVSLTTIPSRIKTVELTIISILSGEMIPNGIYLYLDNITFLEISKNDTFLMNLVKIQYIHLRKVDDVKSYKKLIYALNEHPEKLIVVCDDDVLYPKYWLSALLEKFKKLGDPKKIICHRAHEVSFLTNGKIKPYNDWNQEIKNCNDNSSLLFPTGTGGVLYPPKSLSSLVTNSKLFQKYAPSNDDIWFWLCALSNGCDFSLSDIPFEKKMFIEIPGSQSVSLWNLNVSQNGNDIQLEKSIEYFKSHVGLDLPIIIQNKKLTSLTK